MSSLFEELKLGIQELTDDGKSTKKLRTKKIVYRSIKNYTPGEIKKVRTNLSLTQKAFSNILGVTPKTVEAWESGKNRPSGTASRLIEFYEKEPEKVLELINS